MSAFGPVAAFYDELMDVVPYRMWVSYYELLLAHQDVELKTILDVCCGTGTMCEMLQAEGYEMTGFDLSAPMIEKARAKAKEQGKTIRYEVADAAEFELGEQFDGAFSFFDSLNYIIDPARLQMAFHQVAKHLKPGGSWIFDLNTKYAFEQELFDQENLKSKSVVKYKWHGDWDPISLLIHVKMKFWVDGKEYEETHVQRAHPDNEVRDMLRAAGFEQIRCFHSYTLNPPRYSSDRLHYTAIKSSD